MSETIGEIEEYAKLLRVKESLANISKRLLAQMSRQIVVTDFDEHYLARVEATADLVGAAYERWTADEVRKMPDAEFLRRTEGGGRRINIGAMRGQYARFRDTTPDEDVRRAALLAPKVDIMAVTRGMLR